MSDLIELTSMDVMHVCAGIDVGEALLALAIATALLLLLRSRRPRYDLDAIPGPWRHALPLLGNLPELLRPDFHHVLLNWANIYGGIARVQFLWHHALIVTDPATLAAIMGRGDGAMDKAAAAYAPINRMCDPHGSANLLTSAADDSWKAVRKAVAVSFSMQNIRGKFPLVLGRINALLARLAAAPPGTAVDVDQAALRVTLDIIGLAGFGHDFDAVSQDTPAPDHLLRVLPRCFTEVMLRIANPLRPLAPRLFKAGHKGSAAFGAFQSEMRCLLERLEARAAAGQLPQDDTDIGTQLLRVMAAHPGISRDRILSEIGMLFVEGFETTGHTTSWTLFNIATARGVQEQIAAELDSLGLLVKPGCPAPRELEWADLKRLPFLTACVKEAMRMLPVVSLMAREAGRDMRVGPYKVPAGTLVATPLFAIHNSRHNWSQPERFMPERWLAVPAEAWVCNGASTSCSSTGGGGPEGVSSSSSRRGISFMPFSEGPRSCVGQSLAKMEVLALLAKLCSTFRLELAPEIVARACARGRALTSRCRPPAQRASAACCTRAGHWRRSTTAVALRCRSEALLAWV